MNVVLLMGRLTSDPEEYNGVVKYTLAVDRDYVKEGEERKADFIRCTCFGKNGEFASKYLSKGKKIAIRGSWQTGDYTDNDGKKVYTNDCIVQQHWFAESRNSEQSGGNSEPSPSVDENGFMNIPDGIDEELPFN